MCTRIFSDLASHCVRSLGNRARLGDSDRKAERTGARTSGMRKEARATAKALARLSARLLCKRWKAHLPVSCDKKSGVSWNVPFPGRGPQLKYCEHHRKHQHHTRNLQESGPTGLVERVHSLP